MNAFDLINRDSFISRGITGKGAVVAVIDSGFDVSHPDIADKILGQMRMRDMSTDVTSVSNLHGTAVASVVAGHTCGIAPDARLLILNAAMDTGQNGAGLVAWAIDYARTWRGPAGERVSIINMSFGQQVAMTVMRDAIRRATADGILCIAAAGNSGDGDPETDERAYPAMWPETVSVGAHNTDLSARLSSNSNLEIDLVAPGQSIRAANAARGYSSFSGTSASAPIVSGAAALIYEDLTQRLSRRPTAQELRYELLQNTTLEGITGNTDPRLVGVGRLYLQERSDDDMTRAEFIALVAPVAVKVRVDGGVLYPSVSIAQMILETGGKIHPWNNIVGYKVGSGRRTPYWKGKSVNKTTWEVYDDIVYRDVRADFRAYDSIEDCLKDQALLFINNPGRYQRVIDARTPEEQAQMLQACGYATDPQYANKIMAIVRSHGLQEYDEEAVRAMERLAELEKRLQTTERANKDLLNRLQEMEKQHSMQVPSWAQEAVSAAVQAGYIDTPDGGSIDFYRFVTIMHRSGVFEGRGE